MKQQNLNSLSTIGAEMFDKNYEIVPMMYWRMKM